MKRHLSKILIALPIIVLCLSAVMMAVSATSGSQDGLAAAVTTDKTSYDAGDTANVTVSVTNGNSYDVNNVRLDLTLPSGLALQSGQTAIVVGTLKAGVSQNYTVTATANKATTPVNPSIPQTGGNSNIGLWLALMILSIGALVTMGLRKVKGKRGVKMLSLFLCVTLVLSAAGTSFALPALAATQRRELTVNQPVTVNGDNENITLTVTCDYLLDAVNQTPLAIQEGNLIKTYGDAPFTLTATGGSTGNPVTWTSSDPSVATVMATDDTHATVTILKAAAAPVTITATMPGNAVANSSGNTGDKPDYLDTYAQITLTVNKATLTVTADDRTRAYGADNPAFTVRYDGWVNGDDVSAVTTQPTATCDATTASNVGTYVIMPTGGDAANYTFDYKPGTLTVNITGQPVMEITEGANIGKTYGEAAFKTYGEAAFILTTNGGAGMGAVTWSSSDPCVTVDNTGKVTINGAGTAVLTATKAADGNYTSTTAQTTVNVAKAAFTVTADDQSKDYNTTNPTLTFKYSGFVNNENESALTTKPTASTDAVTDSDVGTYAIMVSGGAAANYDFTYVAGTLTVNMAGQPTLSVAEGDNITKTYGNGAFTLTTAGGAGTGAVTWSGDSACVSVDNSGKVTINGAGTAVITAAKAADGNYEQAKAQTTVTVKKATLTVTADNQTREYKTDNQPFI